jgi:hypothetical protein
MRIHVIAAASVIATASATHAAIVQIGPFPLDGLQEVGPNASPGTGLATVFVDDLTGDFTLDYSFQDLIGTVTGAHFHAGPAGANGAVFFWLTAGGAPVLSPTLPVGVTSGSGSGTGTIPAPNLADFLAGNVYINIHTTSFTGGEIRGQVVPAPAAFATIGGIGLLSISRRRRA